MELQITKSDKRPKGTQSDDYKKLKKNVHPWEKKICKTDKTHSFSWQETYFI